MINARCKSGIRQRDVEATPIGREFLVAPSTEEMRVAIGAEEHKTKSLIILSNADATLTASQMVNGGIFTIVPSTARILTTATAVNILSEMNNSDAGAWFDFTIVCLSVSDVTLYAGVGVTLIGKMVSNNNSITLKALVTSGTTMKIFRT